MFAIKKINQYFHLTGKGQIHSGITLAVFAMSESPKFHQITKKYKNIITFSFHAPAAITSTILLHHRYRKKDFTKRLLVSSMAV